MFFTQKVDRTTYLINVDPIRPNPRSVYARKVKPRTLEVTGTLLHTRTITPAYKILLARKNVFVRRFPSSSSLTIESDVKVTVGTMAP